MKEIIKGAVVVDPALCGEMTLVTIKKSRVFVVPIKFNQRENGIAARGREALRNKSSRAERDTPFWS